jgi:hypothetical protein
LRKGIGKRARLKMAIGKKACGKMSSETVIVHAAAYGQLDETTGGDGSVRRVHII